jgi:hypothetical protein
MSCRKELTLLFTIQIKLYFKGIGAEEVGITKLMAGITGEGYELLMAQVYAVSMRARVL